MSEPAFEFASEPRLAAPEFIDLLHRSTLAERRPVNDLERIERMLRGASIVLTARRDGLLVGVARAVSDFSYCTYLSDLAVDVAYQSRGIGRRLVALVQEAGGPQARLILLSAPGAVTYYPHIGLVPHNSCWISP